MHRLRSGDTEQLQGNPETDLAGRDERKAGLGELGSDGVTHDITVVVEAVQRGGLLTRPRGDAMRSVVDTRHPHDVGQFL